VINYQAIAIYSQVASSVLFLLAMIWIWMKFIQPAVLAAQQAKNAQIAEAERHRDEAKAALDALQGEIDNARRDALAIEQRAQAQAQAEREAVLREAREAGERAVRNAQGELARSRAAAREQLRDEMLEAALNEARVQAAQRVDAVVNQRLVGTFLNKLEHGGSRN
jgi:F0F1-type ATP synthase membrane subunit b/b'